MAHTSGGITAGEVITQAPNKVTKGDPGVQKLPCIRTQQNVNADMPKVRKHFEDGLGVNRGKVGGG